MPPRAGAGCPHHELAQRRVPRRQRTRRQENVAALPPIDGVASVTVSLPGGGAVVIPNAPGKAASARIYAHLAAAHGGAIGPAAAEEGLRLYAEFVDEAVQQPGSHPNIDLLLRVQAEGLSCSVTVEQQ